MYKIIRRSVILGFGLALMFFVAIIYRDVRINKPFNYLSKPESVSYREEATENGGVKSIKYFLDFTATDDYLGAIKIPIRDLGVIDGEVVFKIEDRKNGQIIHENKYDYNYFKNLNTHLFGFPVVDHSKGQSYLVSLIFSSGEDQTSNSILTEYDMGLLQAKYVFPKRAVFENPIRLVSIVKYRLLSLARDINYAQKLVILFALSSFLSIFITISEKKNIHPFNLRSFSCILEVFFKPSFRSTYFAIVFIAALMILPLVVMKFVNLAEKIAEYVWLLLGVGIFWYLATCIDFKNLAKIIDNIKKIVVRTLSFSNHKYKKIIVLFILSMLFLGLNKNYLLGGDDSRLFYLYPEKFLENFASKITSDTSMSGIETIAPPVTSPLALTMLILKKITGPLNLQSILYSINIVGGFVSFFLLTNLLIKNKNKYSKYINMISSLVYVFSVFNIYTLYNSRLIAIYTVSMFPLLLYLFLRAVREREPVILFVMSIICSVFSLFVLAAPWFAATLIGVSPLLFYCIWTYKRTTLKYLTVFILLMLVLNFHWIIYIGNSSVFKSSQGIVKNSITSGDYRRMNEEGIRSVSTLNSVFYPLMNTYHRSIVENFRWAYLPVLSSWSLKILPLNIVFITIFLFAGILLKKDDPDRGVFKATLFSFLLSVYFFTVNITLLGTNLFIWLNNNIPGFVMFRNMYDKFAYVASFSFAMLLAVSIHVVIGNIKNKEVNKKILLVVAVLVFINIKPFLSGEYNRVPIWTTNNTYDSIREFNNDFMDLTDYISKMGSSGKYLIFPLSTGNSFLVQDRYQTNHYYNGVSPLLVMSGKNDFSGLLSFGDMGSDVLLSIKNKDYSHLGKIYQKLNIKYVIVNHTINDELKNSYVFSEGLFFLQDDYMLTQLTGEKIKDFGQSYTLYKINERYDSEKIFLTASDGEISNNDNLTYKKVNTYLYEVTIKDLKNNESLIFLDPYQEGWKLSDDHGDTVSDAHFLALNYANGWKLNFPNDQQANVNLKLYYKPYDNFWFGNTVSIVGYLVSVGVVFGSVIKRLKKND